jgi:hypothetical protein
VDRRVIKTTGSKLVVITIRFDQKQFIDAASAMLSLPPKQRSNDSDHEYMFITVPACVIEHAFPVEAAIFVEVSIEVLVVDSCHVVSLITSGTDIVSISPQKMPSSDASVQARERAQTRAILHADYAGIGTSTAGGSRDVIDLTVDSDIEDIAQSDPNSEIEIIG